MDEDKDNNNNDNEEKVDVVDENINNNNNNDDNMKTKMNVLFLRIDDISIDVEDNIRKSELDFVISRSGDDDDKTAKRGHSVGSSGDVYEFKNFELTNSLYIEFFSKERIVGSAGVFFHNLNLNEDGSFAERSIDIKNDNNDCIGKLLLSYRTSERDYGPSSTEGANSCFAHEDPCGQQIVANDQERLSLEIQTTKSIAENLINIMNAPHEDSVSDSQRFEKIKRLEDELKITKDSVLSLETFIATNKVEKVKLSNTLSMLIEEIINLDSFLTDSNISNDVVDVSQLDPMNSIMQIKKRVEAERLERDHMKTRYEEEILEKERKVNSEISKNSNLEQYLAEAQYREQTLTEDYESKLQQLEERLKEEIVRREALESSRNQKDSLDRLELLLKQEREKRDLIERDNEEKMSVITSYSYELENQKNTINSLEASIEVMKLELSHIMQERDDKLSKLTALEQLREEDKKQKEIMISEYEARIKKLRFEGKTIEDDIDLDDMQQQMAEKTKLVDKLSFSLNYFTKENGDLRSNITESDKRILEKEKQILTLTATAEDLKQNIALWQKKCQMNEEELNLMIGGKVSLELQFSSLKLEIQNKSQEIQELKDQIAHLEEASVVVVPQVNKVDQSSQIQTTNGALDQLDALKKEMELIRIDRDNKAMEKAEIEKTNHKLSAQVGVMQVQLGAATTDIKSLNDHIASLKSENVALKTKDTASRLIRRETEHFKSLLELKQREQESASLYTGTIEKCLKEKDSHIEALTSKLEKKEAELANTLLNKKDPYVLQIEKDLGDKGNEIYRLHGQLKETSVLVDQLREQVLELKTEKGQLESQLDEKKITILEFDAHCKEADLKNKRVSDELDAQNKRLEIMLKEMELMRKRGREGVESNNNSNNNNNHKIVPFSPSKSPSVHSPAPKFAIELGSILNSHHHNNYNYSNSNSNFNNTTTTPSKGEHTDLERFPKRTKLDTNSSGERSEFTTPTKIHTNSHQSPSARKSLRTRLDMLEMDKSKNLDMLEMDKSKKKHVVMISGISYNQPETKELLASMIKNLGGFIRENEFDDHVTHVVTVPGTRTIKTLAAALTHRWIVCEDWVHESSKAGHFLEEDSFGTRFYENPFQGKRFWINAKLPKSKLDNFSSLAVTLGKGMMADRSESADYILVEDMNDRKSEKEITWAHFLDLIPTIPGQKSTDIVSITSPKIGTDLSSLKRSSGEKKNVDEQIDEDTKDTKEKSRASNGSSTSSSAKKASSTRTPEKMPPPKHDSKDKEKSSSVNSSSNVKKEKTTKEEKEKVEKNKNVNSSNNNHHHSHEHNGNTNNIDEIENVSNDEEESDFVENKNSKTTVASRKRSTVETPKPQKDTESPTEKKQRRITRSMSDENDNGNNNNSNNNNNNNEITTTSHAKTLDKDIEKRESPKEKLVLRRSGKKVKSQGSQEEKSSSGNNNNNNNNNNPTTTVQKPLSLPNSKKK